MVKTYSVPLRHGMRVDICIELDDEGFPTGVMWFALYDATGHHIGDFDTMADAMEEAVRLSPPHP